MRTLSSHRPIERAASASQDVSLTSPCTRTGGLHTIPVLRLPNTARHDPRSNRICVLFDIRQFAQGALNVGPDPIVCQSASRQCYVSNQLVKHSQRWSFLIPPIVDTVGVAYANLISQPPGNPSRSTMLRVSSTPSEYLEPYHSPQLNRSYFYLTGIPRCFSLCSKYRHFATVAETPVRRYGGLKDQDRIFTNAYCRHDHGLKGAQVRVKSDPLSLTPIPILPFTVARRLASHQRHSPQRRLMDYTNRQGLGLTRSWRCRLSQRSQMELHE